MATNHACIETARIELGQTRPRAGFVLPAIALILAIVLGIGAADIQRKRVIAEGAAQGADQQETVLDGRGKWGGYL